VNISKYLFAKILAKKKLLAKQVERRKNMKKLFIKLSIKHDLKIC
jgi:hypothetical protein